MLQRILNYYRYSPHQTIVAGRSWYPLASEECKAIAGSYGIPFNRVCAIVACLSPNSNWNRNLIDTVLLITQREGARVTTYNRNKYKALAVLDGADPDSVIAGFKTKAFFANLLGDLSIATIDSHAINAYYGKRITGSSLPTFKGKQLQRIQSDYHRAADIYKEKRANFQAILWINWKSKIANYPDRFGYTKRG